MTINSQVAMAQNCQSPSEIEKFLQNFTTSLSIHGINSDAKNTDSLAGYWIEPSRLDSFNGFTLDPNRPLPEGAAYYGKDHDRYIIPISENPERFLQKSDILIFFTPEFSIKGAHREYEQNGHWHVAIVGQDDSGFLKVQVPASMTTRSFDQGLYHILRPKNLNADASNEVNQFLHRLLKSGKMKSFPQSPFDVYTESDLKKFKHELLDGTRCWETSCAEFAVTAYVLNGQSVPTFPWAARIELLARRMIDEKLRSPVTRAELADKMFKTAFHDSGDFDGQMKEDFDEYFKNKNLKGTALAIFEALHAEPSKRRKILENFFTGDDKSFPFRDGHDIYSSLFLPDAPFEYVGTFIGEPKNRNTSSKTAEIDPMRAYTIGNYRDFTYEPGNVASLLIHGDPHEPGTYNIHLSGNEQYLLSSGGDRIIHLYDRKTLARDKLGEGSATRTVVHPTKPIAAFGGFGGFVKVFDLEDRKLLFEYKHTADIWALVLDSATDQIFSSGDGGDIISLNLKTGETNAIAKQGKPIASLRFDSDSHHLYSLARDGSVIEYDTLRNKEVRSWKAFNAEATWMDLSADHNKLVIAGEKLASIDLKSGNVTELTSQGRIARVFISPDSARIYYVTYDGTVVAHDLKTGEKNIFTKFSEYTDSMDVSPNGKWILIGSWDWRARLINVESGKIWEYSHLSKVGTVRVTDKYFMTGDSSGGVNLFELPKP